MHVPKWFLLVPVVVAALLAWKEYPSLSRYLKTTRM